MPRPSRLGSFLRRHRRLILGVVLLYLIAGVVIVLLSLGPQTEPFLYQVF